MSFTVTLSPSGHQFSVEPGETILRAGLSAGYSIPFSCKQGVCRNCRGKLLQGDVDLGEMQLAYLSEADRAAGYVHLCQAKALSNATVEIREGEGFSGITLRKVPCRIAKLEQPAPDVTIMHLRLPLNENFMFVAGQHIEFILADDTRRTFSIASKPSVDGVIAIEVHIRHIPGGLFSEQILSKMKERELIRFEGPLGSFCLRRDSQKPIIMVASGTGFSPFKSMIESAFELKLDEARPIALYWGGRTKKDLYRAELPELWAKERPNFRFVPVLSEPTPDCNWLGRTGFVHEAVLADIPNLSGLEIYVCGVPAMVDSARRDFFSLGRLPEDAFFADAFLTRADTSTKS